VAHGGGDRLAPNTKIRRETGKENDWPCPYRQDHGMPKRTTAAPSQNWRTARHVASHDRGTGTTGALPLQIG